MRPLIQQGRSTGHECLQDKTRLDVGDPFKPGELTQQAPIVIEIADVGVERVIRPAAHQIAAHYFGQLFDRSLKCIQDLVDLPFERDEINTGIEPISRVSSRRAE